MTRSIEPVSEDDMIMALGEAIAGLDVDSAREVLIDDLVSRLKARGSRPMAPQSPPVKRQVDVLIVAIKNVEALACRAAFDALDVEPEKLGRGHPYWEVERDSIRYGLTSIGSAGTVEAARFVADMSQYVEPRVAVMVGMAVGKTSVALRDVIVATEARDYQLARLTHEGRVDRSKPFSSQWDRGYIEATLNETDAWARKLRPEMQKAVSHKSLSEYSAAITALGNRVPEFRHGIVTSGGSLVENGSFDEFARQVGDLVEAGDMESSGFAAASADAGWPWIVVRGIADHGDPNRTKEEQFPATYHAAAYVRDRLISWLLK